MSAYQPYPKYKPSGVEWLGDVPDGWGCSRLKFSASIENGQDYKHIVASEGYPVFGSGGIFETASEYLFDGESVLFGRKGTIDKPLYVNGRFWTVDTMFYTIPKKNTFPRFLYYFAMSVDYRRLATQTALPSMTQENLGSSPLILPPLPEQRQIAAFLDRECGKLDALQAKQERLIELLSEKRQALISHAVTRGLDPSAKLKPSGIEWLGDVPAHWEVTRLKLVANIQTGVAKGKDNADRNTIAVPYLRVANVQDGYLSLDDVAIIEIPVEDLPRYSLRSGDVLMNEGGDFDKLGRGHVWRGEIDPCIHQNHVFAIRPILVSCEWLSALTSSNYAQFYFMSRSKQSTNLASLSSTNLMELPLLRPPLAEQRAIVAHLDDKCGKIDCLKAKAERAIELLKERRRALISAAVTGKIDVREY